MLKEREFKFTQDWRKVILAYNLPSISSIILGFAVNLSLWILTCKQYNTEFYVS